LQQDEHTNIGRSGSGQAPGIRLLRPGERLNLQVYFQARTAVSATCFGVVQNCGSTSFGSRLRKKPPSIRTAMRRTLMCHPK